MSKSEPSVPLAARRVALALGVGVSVCMAGLLARVAQLQLAPSDALREHMQARVTQRQDLPLRGDLLDRRGRPIASTRFARRVVIDPVIFAQQEHLDWAYATLASAVGMPENDLRARIGHAIAINNERAMLAANWTPEVALARAEEVATSSPPKPDPTEQFRLAPDDPFAVMQAGPPAALVVASIVVEPEPPAPPGPPKPLRYLPLTGVLTSDREQAVRHAVSPPRATTIASDAAHAAMLTSNTEPKPRKKPVPRLRGVSLERVQVRDLLAPPSIAPLVGKVGFGHVGLVGSERWQDDRLEGQPGMIRYVRDPAGRPLWIESDEQDAPKHGTHVRLSIDLEVQRIAIEELTAQIEKMQAQGGRIVVLDSLTGEILAMADVIMPRADALPFPYVLADEKGRRTVDGDYVPGRRYQFIPSDDGRTQHPSLARNRCLEDVYEPGSTFKPFVWATITELGLIKPDEMLNTAHGGPWRAPDGRMLTDVVPHARQSWTDVLVNSSNIGMVQGAQLLTRQQLRDAVLRFGFGERTGLNVPGEAEGIVTPLPAWKTFTQVSVAYGHEIAVTPVQMARAFAAFARPGDQSGLLAPLRLMTPEPGEAQPVSLRVLPPDVAALAREAMARVVESVERRWMKDQTPDGGWRYRLFGKSGTAMVPTPRPPKGSALPKGAGGYLENQFVSSFVAAGPLESPRLVCVAVIDDPADLPGITRKARYGSSAGGPVARKVLERSLTYLGVPASPVPDADAQGVPRASGPSDVE